MLTYADVCWRVQAKAALDELLESNAAAPEIGLQFPCVTGTKVHILTLLLLLQSGFRAKR
jgi:hypothetical protein